MAVATWLQTFSSMDYQQQQKRKTPFFLGFYFLIWGFRLSINHHQN